MDVRIVTFPETEVAAVTHVGRASREHDTARKLIAWKLERRLLDQRRYSSYGLHYTDPRNVSPDEHRVEFCLSVDFEVGCNDYGIYEKTIPSLRCARARDVGSRSDNRAARFLYEEWLPASGELMADFPLIFHYVNVGPDVTEHDAITDVYLPLD